MPLSRLGAVTIALLVAAAQPCAAATLVPIYTFSGSDGSGPAGIVFDNGSIYQYGGRGNVALGYDLLC